MATADVMFIDCTSLNFSYDKTGLVTVSYVMVHNTSGFKVVTSISAGGQSFSGTVVNASTGPIQNTIGWYETSVSLIAAAAGHDTPNWADAIEMPDSSIDMPDAIEMPGSSPLLDF